jgi:hypothetical protein
MDQQVMNLSMVGVHQHRPTLAAAVVNGVRAGHEDGWRAYEFATARQFDDLKRGTLVLLCHLLM